MVTTTSVPRKRETSGSVSVGEAIQVRALTPRAVRQIVLEQSKRADVGHIGSCLSVAHILCALYQNVLRISSPDDPDRDRFVLSKGHAALALYAVLALKGWISDTELDTFCGDDSLLGVHPDRGVRGIDFSSGSLGQGPSMAAGAALVRPHAALRPARLLFNQRRRVQRGIRLGSRDVCCASQTGESHYHHRLERATSAGSHLRCNQLR